MARSTKSQLFSPTDGSKCREVATTATLKTDVKKFLISIVKNIRAIADPFKLNRQVASYLKSYMVNLLQQGLGKLLFYSTYGEAMVLFTLTLP